MRSHDETKISREIFLRSFFAVRPPQRVAQALVALMNDHDFEPGEVIFEIGDMPTDVYFVVDGEIHLDQGEDTAPWVFNEQSVIGISDATLDRPRARRAIARAPSHLLSIRYEDYLELFEDNFDFAKSAMEMANHNIHQQSRSLAPDGVFKPPGTTPVVSPDVVRQRPLNLVERLLVLFNAPFLTDAPVQPLVTLAAQAEEERWSPGQILFEVGEPCTALRFVAVGRIRADLEEPRIYGWFGPGDLVGAHAAMMSSTTMYRMTSEQETVVLKVQKEDLFDLMEDHVRLVRVAFAFVARENIRAREALGARHPSLTDLEPTDEVTGMRDAS